MEGKAGQVKLLGKTQSHFVLRVRIALVLKGIDYQFIEENMQNKSQLLLQSNPIHKRIPVLIHNGNPVCESNNIVEYIDEAWDMKAPNIMPKDPYDRAIARFWVAFIEDKIYPCLRGVFSGQGEKLQKAVEELVANLLLVEEALGTSRGISGKAYFGGDEIGFADIALGSMLPFIIVTQKVKNAVFINQETMPLLSAWMDRFFEVDGLKQVMPDPAELLEYVTSARFTSLFVSNYGNPFSHNIDII